MRIHTTAVPATKYLPVRIHCKLTNDQDVPDNLRDKTYDYLWFPPKEHELPGFLEGLHGEVAQKFAESFGYIIKRPAIGQTLTQRGWKYEVVESA
jgi:hypothetical protein